MPYVTTVPDLAELDDEDLARLYAYPAQPDRPWVRANFVSTLDGSATGPDGRTGTINTESDVRVFAALRALSDVVLVGAGTVRAEGYRAVQVRESWRRVRAALGLAPVPTLAVVTRSLALPDALLEPPEGGGPVVVVTVADADPDRCGEIERRLGPASVMTTGEQTVDVGACLDQLAARGLPRVLCEGGPALLSELASHDLLDELCLTLTPLLVGGTGPRIAHGLPLDVTLRLEHLIEAQDVLLTRWVRRARVPTGS
ncbi:MAG TPA: pyrimidine reductase family protein [Actinomycetales bacterium]|nr:pyrimidine reductase family protein [Actinomycetales bacterium]